LSRGARATIATLLALLTSSAAIQRRAALHLATATIAAARWPYFPGTRLSLRVQGIVPPYATAIAGTGIMLAPTMYGVPLSAEPGDALLIAGNTAGIGALRLHIGLPPDPHRPSLFVASYDDGVVVHDARNFSIEGVLGIGGTAGDVAIGDDGRGVVADTLGNTATLFGLRPWNVRAVTGVPTGDETIVDPPLQAAFVTNRGGDGSGALTRVGFDGSVAAVTTGDTAEGIALDAKRQIVYVANVGDGTIAAIDARSLRRLQRFFAVDRVFSLALAPDGTRLYAVSNTTAEPPLRNAGSVVAIALFPRPRVVTRSAALTFPIGVALDARAHRLFVSDEATAQIDVLDARTLRPAHAPLATCAIPWKLRFEAPSERLYVPCAGANAVDVFDTRRWRRVAGAPFATGGYPLAIALWAG
jgi:DNA-binding beta-propeller fold protein YncE